MERTGNSYTGTFYTFSRVIANSAFTDSEFCSLSTAFYLHNW